MAGFCHTMKVEKNLQSKEFMLDYLVALLDDAQDFSWEAEKNQPCSTFMSYGTGQGFQLLSG